MKKTKSSIRSVKNPIDSFTEILGSYGFAIKDAKIVAGLVRCKTYKRGDFFLKEGQLSQCLGFVESGYFQFFCNVDGEDITTYCSREKDLIVSLGSFFTRTPSRENIRAITPAAVWILDRNDMDRLLRKNAAFQQFYVRAIEHQIVCIDYSRFDLITMSPEERYKKMIRVEADLIQKIPVQYLASILGVTPRHLSRIRKNIK